MTDDIQERTRFLAMHATQRHKLAAQFVGVEVGQADGAGFVIA